MSKQREPTRADGNHFGDVTEMATRKPLTDDEVMLLANESSTQYWGTEAHILRLARSIERAHGIGDEE